MSQKTASIQIAGKKFGADQLFLIAGPCVLESRALSSEVAHALVEICAARGVPLIFKSSFDKANRSSAAGVRGPGLDGLEWLAEIKARHQIPVLTDVHEREQCAIAAQVVDVLQIPAFLCRQTDLLLAAANTGKTVNIKKGQFLAPWDMSNVVKKCSSTGNHNLMVTERGTSFGYGRLVVDMTGFEHLYATGYPVVFDATHSVQQPGGLGDRTGGDRRQVPGLARAAVATGFVHGLFFEVHPDPDKAPSDGPNMVRLAEFPSILDSVLAIDRAIRH